MFKRGIIALVCGLCGCLLLSVAGVGAACQDISDRVLRLHVVAASDSERDQTLKLQVRDAVLQETEGLLDGVLSTALAKERLQEALPRVQTAAERCLRANRCDDSVRVELCEMFFTARTYETVTLPAGDYEALRVTIGEGQGKNWWCVVFPPMCLSGACEQELSDVLTDDACDVVTHPERYEVRLKVVEWWQKLRHRET